MNRELPAPDYDPTSRDIPTCVGPMIFCLRKSRRLSLAKLASAANVSAAYLNRIEKSERTHVNYGILSNVATALGIDVATLLGDGLVSDAPVNSKLESNNDEAPDSVFCSAANSTSTDTIIDIKTQRRFVFDIMKGICESETLSNSERLARLKILADISQFLFSRGDV